jgi:hypothetical protein
VSPKFFHGPDAILTCLCNHKIWTLTNPRGIRNPGNCWCLCRPRSFCSWESRGSVDVHRCNTPPKRARKGEGDLSTLRLVKRGSEELDEAEGGGETESVESAPKREKYTRLGLGNGWVRLRFRRSSNPPDNLVSKPMYTTRGHRHLNR